MKKIRFIFSILVLSMFIAACNENDISKIVKSLPDVQQFLKEHPNADMKIVYMDETAVAGKIADIRQQCTEDVKQTSMYYVEFKEGTDTNMKMWLDANSQQVLCAVKKSNNVVITPKTNETLITEPVIQINESLTDEEVMTCFENFDCIKSYIGNCGCDANGRATSINKKYENYWTQKNPRGTCITVPSDDASCAPNLMPRCIGGSCKLIVPEEKENPRDEELRACSKNDDCIRVNAGNCDCMSGGGVTSINKKYNDYWNEKFPGGICVAVITNSPECSNGQPKCVSNACKIVVPQNDETPCSTSKIMTAGDTATVNLKGTQAVVTLVGVNSDKSLIMTTINGESKQINVGETTILSGISIYVKKISPYVVPAIPHEVELVISTRDCFTSNETKDGGITPENETVIELDETNLTLEYNLGKASCPTARADSGVGIIGSKIYFIAGGDRVNDVNTAEIYDVETNICSPIASLSTQRSSFPVAAMNEKVYAFGGYSPGANPQNSAEVYDPVNNSWSRIANLPHTWTNMIPGTYNGKIYLATGEIYAEGYTTDVYEYDPVTNNYTAKTPIPSPQSKAAFTVYGSEIYLFGGRTTGNVPIYTIRSYNMATDKWSDHGTFPIDSFEATIAQFNNKFYIFAFSNNITNIYSFNPITDKISLMSFNIPVAKSTVVGAMYDNKFYLYGGNSPSQWFTDVDEISIQ